MATMIVQKELVMSQLFSKIEEIARHQGLRFRRIMRNYKRGDRDAVAYDVQGTIFGMIIPSREDVEIILHLTNTADSSVERIYRVELIDHMIMKIA